MDDAHLIEMLERIIAASERYAEKLKRRIENVDDAFDQYKQGESRGEELEELAG